MTISQRNTSEQIALLVPGLEKRPFVGGGCCAISAQDMIRGELTSRGGVSVIAIDGVRVIIALISSAPDLPDLLQHLEDIDYPATIPDSITGIISERGSRP